jgi:hypothetical protein
MYKIVWWHYGTADPLGKSVVLALGVLKAAMPPAAHRMAGSVLITNAL